MVSHAISDITSALIGVKTKENRTINAITKKEEKKEEDAKKDDSTNEKKKIILTAVEKGVPAITKKAEKKEGSTKTNSMAEDDTAKENNKEGKPGLKTETVKEKK